jgi:hypothetical protein
MAPLKVEGQNTGPFVVLPPGISFSSLPGPNGAPYSGHSEGDFTVTPTATNWFQSLTYGNPAPSILDGPIGSPGIGVVLVTDNVDLFVFGALDYSSNNGNSSYDIQGYLGPTLMYHQTGALAASFTPFSFNTLLSTDPEVRIDALLIEFFPGPGVTSINLDNIRVTTIPEPSAFLVLSAGVVVGLLARARTAQKASRV